jgi:HAMP domain-containing protein
MRLKLKFNLILILVFLLGLAVSAQVSHDILRKNAREEVIRHANLILEAALAVRSYTVSQVKPHLELQLMRVFLPQSVPAFAAAETMGELRKKQPDYSYKEAALNPTNPRNRATDWEADLIQVFRDSANTREIVGERNTSTGPSLYIARPIQIKQEACLACHNTPTAAPATMIKLYGDNNGFGWKLNEVIGAQIVSVPMSLPILNADRAFLTFMALLVGVFAVLFIVLNLMLNRMIVKRIAKMSRAAGEVSTGNFEVPEFAERGRDEIAALGRSFNRMRRSLEKALQMIEA